MNEKELWSRLLGDGVLVWLDADSKLRIEYCAPKAGEYKLTLSPSTADYYAFAGVDCSRFGPEGLKRVNGSGKH